ncbi:MAG: hypothetical protein V3T01_01510 [Myxococcota bacterium]
MDLRGGLVLGARAAGAMSRILDDRVGESLGSALPRTAVQLARPEVVNALLRDHAPNGSVSLPPIRAVHLPGVEFESSNCTNFLIELEATLRTVLRRSVAAIERLDFGSWLAGL